MILLDYSQIVVSNFMMANGGKVEVTEDIIRHMVLNSIRAINNKHGKKYGRIVICADGSNTWRKAAFPYYKAKRKKNRDESVVDWNMLYSCAAKVRDELQVNFTYPVVKIDSCEADDVIATLAKESNKPVLIVSGDKDFIQLHTNPNISQYDNVKDRAIVHADPQKFLFEHIMRGDEGDGVPNILSDDDTFVVESKRQRPMFQKKLDLWYESISAGDLSWAEEHIEKINRNKKLIDLSFIPKSQKTLIKAEYDKELKKEVPKSLFFYFSSKGLVNLTEKINDFKEHVDVEEGLHSFIQ